MAALGNHAGRCGSRYALPTGGFRAAEFHWPLSSDEFKEQTDAARPVPALPSVLSDSPRRSKAAAVDRAPWRLAISDTTR
jgi:hypothetical protein